MHRSPRRHRRFEGPGAATVTSRFLIAVTFVTQATFVGVGAAGQSTVADLDGDGIVATGGVALLLAA